MSPSGNEQVAREMYQALSAREYDAAAYHLSEGVLILNVATGDLYRGREGFLEFARGWAAAMPDIRFGLVNVGGEGSKLVVEYEMMGTHTGALVTPKGHIPPTGMEVQVRFCDVLEMANEKVTHVRSYFDSVTLLRQLGIIMGTPIHAPDRRAALELYAQPVESHAPQRHKAIVQRFVQDVFNRQSPGAAPDTCAKSYAWHGGALGDAKGLAAYQEILTSLFLAFPDLEMEILDCVADTDRVVIRFAMRGTHLGDFQGVAPTYKRVAGGGTTTYRLEDSRIVEEWWQGDILALLQQMDAAPSTVPLSS